MDKSLDGRLRLIGWMGSFVFHLVLVLFGAFLFIQPARFTAKAGEISTEIELTAEPKSPAVVPSVPPIPPTPPQPVIPATPPPTPPLQEIIPAPQQETLSLPKTSPTPLVAKPQPNRPVQPKAAHQRVSTETSNASKGAVEAQPDNLRNEPPVYPEESQAAREEGLVILRVEVTEGGVPVSVSILKSSGYFRLDQAARRAVQHWKFHPSTVGGIPVHSEVNTPVRFKLQ
jgi:protein TonB